MPNDAAMPEGVPSRAAPPAVVVLPTPLLRLFPTSRRRVEVAAATVGEAIEALDARWPGMRDRLCDSRPGIRRHIRVFVDGAPATLGTRLPAGAEVFIITAISGG